MPTSSFIHRPRIATLLSVGLCVVLAVAASPAQGQIRIRSIARVKGQESLHLRGVGLVVGLNGTGDPDLPTTYRALGKLLTGSGFELNRDLNGREMIDEFTGTQNAALVFVTAEIPEGGLRQGSRIRCRVDSFGAATSLVGGNLMEASLTGGPLVVEGGEMPILAIASGPVDLVNPRHATAGKIDDGCQVVVDFEHRFTYVARISNEGQQFQIDPLTGRPLRGSDELDLDAPEMMFFDLVIKPEHATFGTATEIAETVREYSFVPNGDAEVNAAIPRAKDQVTVQVPIPSQYAEDPVQYISEVLDLELHNKPKSTTVVINRQSGVLIIGDDVRFDPAAVSSGGMMVETESVRRLDLEDNGLVPPGPGVQLKKLTAALNQLQVPSETLMDIIVQLKEGGFLYGELIIQE